MKGELNDWMEEVKRLRDVGRKRAAQHHTNFIDL